MHTQRPVRRQGITGKTIGKETFLYDLEKGTVHILNTTAHMIWDLCNGEHTVEDINNALQRNFTIPAEKSFVNDIKNTLSAFHKKGLLQTAPYILKADM